MNPPHSLLSQDLNEDIFLPSSKASLANIFGHNSASSTSESLMFIPPKPPEMLKMTDEYKLDKSQSKNKHSECILGKAIHAYHLVAGTYESKGKLGFAIVRMFQPAHVMLVIFNATKTTLSSTLLTHNLQVTINGNYMTYYDDSGQNWSLLFSVNELSEVTDELKNHHVKLKYQDEDQSKSQASKLSDTNIIKEKSKVDSGNELFESGLEEASENHITQEKKSLINRMAAMGQAILPPKSLPLHNHSETIDNNNFYKEKHEPSEYSQNAPEINENSHKTYSTQNFEKSQILKNQTNLCEQIVPVTDMNISKYSFDSLTPGIIISNNKELKLGVDCISDKVDKVLDKLAKFENLKTSPIISPNENISDFTTEIYKKLLKEYEEKINIKDKYIISLQEELLTAKSKGSCIITDVNIDGYEKFKDVKIISNDNKLDSSCQTDTFDKTEKEISKLKVDNQNLLEKVEFLQKDLEKIQFIHDNEKRELIDTKEKLIKVNLEKHEKLQDMKEVSTQYKNVYFDSEIKEIMNNTYRAISVQLHENETYGADVVRSILASAIRETTLDVLSNTLNDQ